MQTPTSSTPSILPELGRTILSGLVVVTFCSAILNKDPEFYWIDDNQNTHLAGAVEIHRQLARGDFPVLTSSWYAGSLPGEFLYGVFSIFKLALSFAACELNLTLPATAAVISFMYLFVLATGAFRLARSHGLQFEYALFATLVASLNGWIMCWGARTWILNLSGFVWVPWTWWFLERSLRPQLGRCRFLPTGVCIYLVAASGSPWSCLMVATVTVWMALRSLYRGRPIHALWPLAAAPAMGIGLAMPSLLTFIQHYLNGIRLREVGDPRVMDLWVVPVQGYLGLFLPAFPTPLWNTFRGEPMHASIELACGLAPPVAVIVGILKSGRKFIKTIAWELALLLLLSFLVSNRGFWNFNFSFRWLPLFHLVLGMIAGKALRALYENQDSEECQTKQESHLIQRLSTKLPSWIRSPGYLGVASFLSVSLTLGIAFFIHPRIDDPRLYAIYGKPMEQLGIAFLIISFGWFLIESLTDKISSIRRYAPCGVVLSSLWLTYAYLPTRYVVNWNRTDELRNYGDLDSNTTYLSLCTSYDFFQLHQKQFGELLRIGNTTLYADLRFVNGYSSVKLSPYIQIIGFDKQAYFPDANRALKIIDWETNRNGMLALMGVNGLVVGQSLASKLPGLLSQGWRWVASDKEGFVLHRDQVDPTTPRHVDSVKLISSKEEAINQIINRVTQNAPLVLVDKRKVSGAHHVYSRLTTISSICQSRRRTVIRVENESDSLEALIMFTKPWYPGYQATFNGKQIPVKALNLILPAVEIPPASEGELVLEYFPSSLRYGLYSSVLSIICATLLVAWEFYERRSKSPKQ